MKSLQHIQHVYFVGIGGIGMSALARYLKLIGIAVYGYDKTKTSLTAELTQEGIPITYVDNPEEIPSAVKEDASSLVVFTPAIPNTNAILTYFKEGNFEIVKRAKLLGEITKDTLCLAVAGTHGKTTTSCILGHLMAEVDMPVTAFLGGIAENYHSNFIFKGKEITVVEADEFDRSFLQLYPDIACVTSMDADHLDIYGDSKSIESSFIEFSELLPKPQNLLYKKGLPLQGLSVGIEESADFEANNVRIEDGSYVFDLKTPNVVLQNLRFTLPGHHNLHNAITALGMAILAGAPADRLPEALLSFRGVERRFSYKIREDNLVLIDDYAHHPTEIEALFQAVDELYPNEPKLIVFQPQLFSRTKDFINGFAESLSRFDEVYLLDIYPAREEPIEGITSNWLLTKIQDLQRAKGKISAALISKEKMPATLKNSKARIKLLVGAGDIGAEVEKVTEYLKDAS